MDKSLYLLVVLVGLLLRILTGFSPYSGESSAPKFGDYEAQRHWMEITVNLTPQQWYTVDADYWPLDYPPLTAYHEWIMGIMSWWFEPESVESYTSRGYETNSHRQIMRMSVVISDFLVYFLGAFLVSRMAPVKMRFVSFLILIVNPVAIYIDHAHFQYNTVALGFLLGAIFGIQADRPFLAAILFTCSFMFKQTFVYFAPIFLAYMLGEAIRFGGWNCVVRVAVLGAIVIGVITAIVFPIVFTPCGDSLACSSNQLSVMIQRIFPFGRGLLEDYVANVWTVLTPVLRLRNMTPLKQQLCGLGSLLGTIGGFIEVFLIVLKNPTPRVFPIALAVSAMSFYLFGWMVHEKAILLGFTAMISGLPVLKDTGKSHLIFRFMEACVLSMWRLMKIEGNQLAAYALLGVAWIASRYIGGLMCCERGWVNRGMVLMNIGAFISILFDCFVPTPGNFDYLWILANCTTCCVAFLLIWRDLIGIVKAESVPTSQKVKSN